MKTVSKFCLVAFLLAYGSICHAQTEKGSWLIGGSGSYQHLKNDDVNTKENIFSLSPRAGIFIIKNLAIGLTPSVSWDHQKFENQTNGDYKSSSWTVGPFARYYYNLSSSVSLFAEGSFGYGGNTYKSGGIPSKSHFYTWYAGPGVAFFLSHSVSLDFSAAYMQNKVKGHFGDKTNTLKAQFGFSIYIPKGH